MHLPHRSLLTAHLLAAIVASVVVPKASAYSVEISCDDKGQLLGHQYRATSSTDFSKNRRSLKPGANVRDLCRDFKKCFAELSDVAKLSRDTSDILQKYMVQFEPKARNAPTPAVAAYHGEVARLQELLGDCTSYRGIALSDKAAGTVSVFYPFNGPLSGKVSRNYDRASLEELVNLSVKAGADPYMVLAIKLLEDPPLKRTKTDTVLQANLSSGEMKQASDGADDYKNGYGLLPIDQVAGRDVLGCRTELRSKLRSNATSDQVREYQALQQKSIEPSLRMVRLPRNVISEFDRLSNAVTFFDGAMSSEQFTLDSFESTQRALPIEQRSIYDGPIEKSRLALAAMKSRLAAATDALDRFKSTPGGTQYQKIQAEMQALATRGDEIRLAATKGLSEGEVAATECVLKGKSQCYGRAVPQAKVPSVSLTDNATRSETLRACEMSNQVEAGASMSIGFGATSGCCVDVNAPPNADKEKLRGQLLTSLAITYAKNRVQASIKPGGQLSWALQGYNGRSCFGCTEGKGYYGTTCMGNIDMNTRPVYGAKAADLITNSLMRNPAIVEMVEAAAANSKTRPTSVLCLSEGRGVHLVSDQKFLDEQTKYLLRSEPARAKLCAPLFKNSYRSASAQ